MRSSSRGQRHVKRVQRVADMLERQYGRRKLSGRRSEPLETLIGTLLSQNTSDVNSHRAWLSLRRRYPTWKQAVEAPAASLAAAIKVGGLKNQKARRIKQILRRVKKDWGIYSLDRLHKMTEEEVMEYLLSMKGVGEKTAACVLVFALKRDVFPVDTHIHRVCNRLGLVATRNAEETFETMKNLVPAGGSYSLHVNLIQFGREICDARKPLCAECPLFEECVFDRKYEYATRGRARGLRDAKPGDFFVIEHLSTRPSRRRFRKD